MADIKMREDKMIERKKSNSFRKFIKEIGSRYPLVFSKNNGMLSRYPKTDRIKGVIKTADFDAQADSLTTNGLDLDDSVSFFELFGRLMKKTDMPSMYSFWGNENADFADTVGASKNIYLSSVVIINCENVLYSSNVKDGSTNVLNSVMVLEDSNNVYNCFGVKTWFNIFYSNYIYNCSDIRFSANLNGCKDCIFCTDLENQSYCIENKQFEKDEYMKQKAEILKNKKEFLQYYMKVRQYDGKNVACTNSEGNFLMNCENVQDGHLSFNVKDGRNIVLAFSREPNERFYDVFCAGRSTDMYGVSVAWTFSSKVFNSFAIQNSSNIYYGFFLSDCSYCLGCIGLKNKQFCILNKQYSQEDWYEEAGKIFAQMDKEGTLGDCFPGSINPFYFNDTMAYLVDDTFNKEEVGKEWYLRRDNEITTDIPANADVIQAKDLDKFQRFSFKGEREIDPEIMKKVIKDDTWDLYKIVKMEYDFLMRYGLPLPEIHRLDRIKLGFKFK